MRAFLVSLLLLGCSSSRPDGLLAGKTSLDGIEDLRVVREHGTIAVQALEGAVLAADDATLDPSDRATAFLARHGALLGVTTIDGATTRDVVGGDGDHYVRVAQQHAGMRVLGGELVVYMNDVGIVAVAGRWLDDIAVPTNPRIGYLRAIGIAHGDANKQARPGSQLAVRNAELAVYRTGIVDPRPPTDHLAWRVEVRGEGQGFIVWVDATTGAVLASHRTHHAAKFRVAYAQSYSEDVSSNPFTPGPTAVCREDQPGGGIGCAGAAAILYRFTGQVHDFFMGAFGRDSYDGAGIKMRTVNLVNQNCPNAYWDGTTTNYCPDFELDDVVAHEWGHAYTQYTHDLIYAYQSGALNEAYSDIWGETVDLLNGEDGLGGSMNAEAAPTGVRWAVGEDFGTGSGEYELLLRDMWDPDRLGYPGKVSSENYACGTGDGGGVHTNSGVPNHMFALLVDGTDYYGASCTTTCRAPLTCNTQTSKCEYNGQSIAAIGFVKAAHIYFQASLLQTETTNFPQHATALEMACSALAASGTAKNGFFGLPAATVTAADCAQVTKAIAAVELKTPPSCGFEPLLKPNPPATCRGASALLSQSWSSGLVGWTKARSGTPAMMNDPDYDWTSVTMKPANKPGSAAFAPNHREGTCVGDGDYSGSYSLDSPLLTAPPQGHTMELRFDHFVETELGYDGGQLLLSVGGGPYQLVPASAYRHNGPNMNLEAPVPVGQNTNPNAGERAWSGADGGATTGSWGTTVVDLANLVQPGQTFRLRFEFSIDGCNGVTGWYLGDLVVNDCPPLPGPTLALGSDYSNPDPDGSYTLQWTRPTIATTSPTGPDELQESTRSCAPALNEPCNNFAQWNRSETGAIAPWTTATKPNHPGNVFRAGGVEHTKASATITTMAPIVIPAGAKATLRWQEWYANEPDDMGVVEVSGDAGATWVEIYKVDRALQAPADQAALASEPMFARSARLDAFAGKNLLIRFRYILGDSNYFFYAPNGWYLDNIVVDVDQWVTLVDANVTSRLVSGKADGRYCYRVRTTHVINGSPIRSDFSNVVTAIVDQPGTPLDTDLDTIVDSADNCVTTPNTDQANADGDALGDACDACFGASNMDDDGDKRCNEADNCPMTANPTQKDSDGDGKGDACDCGANEDADADNVCNLGDNCPTDANPSQTDSDEDGNGDVCDPCDGVSNIDPDLDMLCDERDNCPAVGNPDQTDTDGDGIGDACDCVAANDQDGDGACNAIDNCPMAANPDQQDADDDGLGDACDACVGFPNDDLDGDGTCDTVDNCPDVPNPEQNPEACQIDACPDDRPCFADDGGCGCRSEGGAAGLLPAALVGLLLLRRRRGATALLALALVAPGAARAEEPRKLGLSVGGFVVGFVADEDHEFYDYMTTTQVPLGAVAPGFGLRAALFPLPFLGVEVEGEYLRSATESRASVNLFGFGGHLIVQKPGELRPFVLGGFGGMGVSSKDSTLGDDVDAVGYAGIGVAYDLTARLAVRADARYLRAPRAMSEDEGTNHFWFGVGVSGNFEFGGGDPRPAPVEQPPPPPPVVVQAPPPPPADSDGDGYNDLVDKCRDNAEDFDQFQDEDGCPEPDNDGDGANDVADKCPLAAGPLENAGCPDTDRDKDTVVDRLDNCPDEPGTVANHGCKDKQLVVITPTKLQILDRVYFQTNSAKLLPKSNKLLDNVARVLLAHPELATIVIEGHTDDRGDDAYNLDLSQRRADAVKDYLVKKQVQADRLQAKGFGKTQPIDPATTGDARAANRRVEFQILSAQVP